MSCYATEQYCAADGALDPLMFLHRPHPVYLWLFATHVEEIVAGWLFNVEFHPLPWDVRVMGHEGIDGDRDRPHILGR